MISISNVISKKKIIIDQLYLDLNNLRMHWSIFTTLKTSKKAYEVMFFDRLKYMYSENLFSILYIEMKDKCSKNFFKTKKKCTLSSFASSSFFIFASSLFFVCFTFNLRFFLWAEGPGLSLLKRLWGFPFLIPFHSYWSLVFCLTKSMDFFTLKRPSSFQNSNSKKNTHDLAFRCLYF